MLSKLRQRRARSWICSRQQIDMEASAPEGGMMYSTGTEFYKLIGQAQEGKGMNTAADIADNVKDAIESNTPFRVVRMSLEKGVDMTVVGKIADGTGG